VASHSAALAAFSSVLPPSGWPLRPIARALANCRLAGLPATEPHSVEFFFTALSFIAAPDETYRTQGLEFRNRRSRAYFDKQISVPTYATNHPDPLAASAPPVEPTLLLTRPSRSPIFLIYNIIYIVNTNKVVTRGLHVRVEYAKYKIYAAIVQVYSI
jgi:hypothetical protein